MKIFTKDLIGEVDQLVSQAQKLKWAMALPAREGLMLMDGIDEPRGSDYTRGELQRYVY